MSRLYGGTMQDWFEWTDLTRAELFEINRALSQRPRTPLVNELLAKLDAAGITSAAEAFLKGHYGE